MHSFPMHLLTSNIVLSIIPFGTTEPGKVFVCVLSHLQVCKSSSDVQV